MRCKDAGECLEQIQAYCEGEKTGYFLLANTENYDVYQEIRQRLEADGGKKCIYLSDNCQANGMPDIAGSVCFAGGGDNSVLIGLSQALMLRGGDALREKLDEVLSYSVGGHGIILLLHCEQVLQKFLYRDLRLQNRIILVEGAKSCLPKIKLARTTAECGAAFLDGIPALLRFLERLTSAQLQAVPVVTVLSKFSAKMFRQAVYSVRDAEGVYEILTAKYRDLAGAALKTYGAEEEWNWLASKLTGRASFAALVCGEFGALTNLSMHLGHVWQSGDKNKKWLLWLALKVFGEPNNHYLTRVLQKCAKADDFAARLYLELAEIDADDPDFSRYYDERKNLLNALPPRLPLVKDYCEKLAVRAKDALFYLTDGSEQEKHEFMRCLGSYDFTPEEIERAAGKMSAPLALYLRDFTFDAANTKVPDGEEAFREDLTAYFKAYKLQKLTNRILPDFLARVEKYAASPRPYNKLQSRSQIVARMDKANAKCFFFDALGVEYLAFIAARCAEYGMELEAAIGRCELPSITEKNKEFLQYFADGYWKKIDALDEVKHHSQIYDYSACKYPVHLFRELEIIDEQLLAIQSMLVQGTLQKAVIVADHGASRLAVLYGHELDARIELDEAGEHSGRCCPADGDPCLPFAAYENGFAVLANYERFKGGRRANVEVHGGASLEEVVVPVLTLTKRLENIEIRLIKTVIVLQPRVVPQLELYANIPLRQPRLRIGGEFYDGELQADQKHAVFAIPSLKRKGSYVADVYDGEKNMSLQLRFETVRKTREVELF